MQVTDKQLSQISNQFKSQKYKLPADIAWKLQYMLDVINETAVPIQELNEAQKNQVKDLEDLQSNAIKLIFVSIVTSILSPNLYCSFQKNCRIKLDGLMPRWTKVYASFKESEICFTNRKKKMIFVVEGLECNQTTQNQLQFKYKGIKKLKIKFDNSDAARNMYAKVKKMIQEFGESQKKLNGFEVIINNKAIQQELQKKYIVLNKSKDYVYMAHKSEPKIHITLFMKGQFWNIFQLGQFLSCHSFWSSRIKEQKIMQTKHNSYLIQRRLKSSSLLSWQRRTFTNLRIKKLNQNSYIIEQQNVEGVPTTKNIILSQFQTVLILQILSPKIVKVTLNSSFNGRGHFSTSNSRTMLIDLFSDFLHAEQKYKKMKQKNKLVYKLLLQQKIVKDNQASIHNFEPLLSIRQDVKPQTKKQQAYFSIENNKDYMGNVDEINQQQFYDMDGEYEQQMENTVVNSEEINNVVQIPQEIQEQKKQIAQQQTQNTIVSAQYETFQKLSPSNFDSKINLDYIKLIKNRVNQKIYLNKTFNQKVLKVFQWETPCYDPSIIIPAGREYQANQKNQLIFINYDLIKGQKDSLIFVIKQVGANLLCGKSVLNVSLPVDIFQSRSLLQRSAASFACAPKYLKPVAQAPVLTQLSSVIGFLSSVNPLQLIMLKPFNPILGQTFQCLIGGIPFYYQQISHHPPISSYFMKCQQFTLYGNLIAVANVSLNSGAGGNAGKMNIVMKNGSHFQLSFFPGEISGLIYGKRKYAVCAKAFVFQRKSKLVAQISINKQSKGVYEWKEINVNPTLGDLIGGVFKVKDKFLQENPVEKSMMYHSGLKKSDIEQKISTISGIWFSQIKVGKQIINKDKTAYPVQYSTPLLPSDSNYRMDILMHKLGDLARSQNYKEMLEGVQRNDRKLRQHHHKNKKE